MLRLSLSTRMVVGVAAFGLLACSQSPDKPSRKSEGKKAPNSAQAVVQKPMVDGSTLGVMSVRAAKALDRGIHYGSISYEVHPEADFVWLRACQNETGKCFESTTALNRLSMPPFAGGRVTITARACVEPNRSTNPQNCGEQKQSLFIHPSNANSPAAQLMFQKSVLVKQLKGYDQQLVGILEKFQRDSEVCLKNTEIKEKVAARREMVSGFLALGQSLISSGLAIYQAECGGESAGQQNTVQQGGAGGALGLTDHSDMKLADDGSFFQKILDSCVPPSQTAQPAQGPGGQTKIEEKGNGLPSLDQIADFAKDKILGGGKNQKASAGGKPASMEPEGAVPINLESVEPAVKQVESAAGKLEGFSEYTNVVAGALSAVGLYEHKPVNAIQSIGTSIFDLMSGDKELIPKCNAEQTAYSESKALKQLMDATRRRIADIDTQISLGATAGALP